MNSLSEYHAPWGALLKLMTAASVSLLTGIALFGIFAIPRHNAISIVAMIVFPLIIIVGSALFTIRGYVLTPEALLIQRPGWNSKLELSDLLSAEVDASAMARSIRTFGNGGMFCLAGYFRNNKLGSYRALATDPKRSVVLRFKNRTVVVTPDRPEDFVARIKGLRNL
jgi:hypothetical protein